MGYQYIDEPLHLTMRLEINITEKHSASQYAWRSVYRRSIPFHFAPGHYIGEPFRFTLHLDISIRENHTTSLSSRSVYRRISPLHNALGQYIGKAFHFTVL